METVKRPVFMPPHIKVLVDKIDEQNAKIDELKQAVDEMKRDYE